MESRNQNIIVLFDVDGTLTLPRKSIMNDMVLTLEKLKKKCVIGIVGGSDLIKITEQVGQNVINMFDYVFSENGLHVLQQGQYKDSTSIKEQLGEDNIKRFLNFCLRYLSEIDIPIKRGTFIEFRNGLINISPIGRNCSQQERDDFEQYDKIHQIRLKFIQVLQEQFKDLNLKYSIGGQISFDVFPQGWDKTYCLKYLTQFQEVYFYGDKTYEGGNDYEIFTDSRTKGFSVTGPQDTIKFLNETFLN